MTGDAVDCYSVSKVEVYQYAYDHGKLPKMGVIYIGQKRNIWLWDFEKQEKVEQMNFDALRERMESNRVSNQLFLDVVYDQAYYPAFLHGMQMVDYHLPQQWIERYVEEKGVKPTKAIEANYMIDPKIG
ncbi:MAG: hypothetical protein LBU27_00150 [Candidatus Peribacteria bacterium]|nr:hypothetical protein [Candidatus Peribacteria bacterium]